MSNIANERSVNTSRKRSGIWTTASYILTSWSNKRIRLTLPERVTKILVSNTILMQRKYTIAQCLNEEHASWWNINNIYYPASFGIIRNGNNVTIFISIWIDCSQRDQGNSRQERVGGTNLQRIIWWSRAITDYCEHERSPPYAFRSARAWTRVGAKRARGCGIQWV